MRLAFLTNVFPSPIAPTKGTFNWELVKALSCRHEVVAVVPVAWTDECRAWWRKGQRLLANRQNVTAGVRSLFPRFWYPPGLARASYDKFLSWSIRKTLVRLESEFQPDAILSYWAHPDGAVAVEWAKRLGIPGWIMVGGSDVLLLAKDQRRGEAIRRALRAANGVISVSHDIAHELARQGLPPQNVHVVYRGVDSQQFFPREKDKARAKLGIVDSRKLLIWVGRMVEVKGLDLLMAAAGRAKTAGAQFQLALIGDGPLRSALESQVRRLNLGQEVSFVGNLPHKDLPIWYQAADWTVLSSHSEGVPNVLLESHACGTPFVATAVGGVPEIAIEGVDKLAVKGDPDSFARALVEACKSRCPDGQSLAARVKSVDQAADAIASLIEQQVGAGPIQVPASAIA